MATFTDLVGGLQTLKRQSRLAGRPVSEAEVRGLSGGYFDVASERLSRAKALTQQKELTQMGISSTEKLQAERLATERDLQAQALAEQKRAEQERIRMAEKALAEQKRTTDLEYQMAQEAAEQGGLGSSLVQAGAMGAILHADKWVPSVSKMLGISTESAATNAGVNLGTGVGTAGTTTASLLPALGTTAGGIGIGVGAGEAIGLGAGGAAETALTLGGAESAIGLGTGGAAESGLTLLGDTTTGAGGTISGVLAPAGIGFGVGTLVGGAIGEGSGTKGGLSGAGAGALAGAAYGSIVPGVGTAVGAIVGAIAGAIGGIFGSKKSSGCCFIFIASHGFLHPIVRHYRDTHMTQRNRRGYYWLADRLVPAMKKHRSVEWLVKWLMVKPMTCYGKYYYNLGKAGAIYAGLTKAWLTIFDILGNRPPYQRQGTDEIV